MIFNSVILNTRGDDISDIIIAAATKHNLDPIALLALIKAESGLNQKAERWGSFTGNAQNAIELGNTDMLQSIIDHVWPDISFSYSQRIVLYHDQGDHMPTVENCLAVRDYVFTHPDEDLGAAADRLARAILRSSDGSVLGGMCVYNAGSDYRDDPVWVKRWGGNVASYQSAITWAEALRDKP